MSNNVKYKWMSLQEVLKYLPQIKKENVSVKARSKDGFLTHYKKFKYANIMYDKLVPDSNMNWSTKRKLFIQRTLPAYKSNPTIRRKLALIAWAYYPE